MNLIGMLKTWLYIIACLNLFLARDVSGLMLLKQPSQHRSTSSNVFYAVLGPNPETKPDYENIHGPLGKELDRLFLKMFRSRLAENIGIDSSLPNVNICMILC